MVRNVCLVVAVLALAVGSAVAQDPAKPVTIYLGGGVSVPTGTLGDGWNLGFHGNGRVGFSAAPKLDVLGSIAFHAFAIDDMGVTGIEGGTLTALMFGGDLKLNLGLPGSSTNPYLIGGAGLAIAAISDLTIAGLGTLTTDSETKPYVRFGAGLGFQKFFIEGAFVSIFTEGDSINFIPIVVGVKF